MASGKLHSVWVRISRIPNTMKTYQALCEIRSSLGVVQEVDMEVLEAHDVARMKIGVKDPLRFWPNLKLQLISY